ncbi:MAG: SurA N-terminal domain-containing protein [Oceanicoccus sp.]
MLQNIRENSQGLIAKFIIGLIVLTFALFGIDSLVGGSGPAIVATVNGDDITLADLEQGVSLERRRLLTYMGDNADPSLLDEQRLRGPVLERLIQQKLLLQAAEDASIGISDAALDQTIVAMEQFHEGGKFSPERYQSILRGSGYSTAFYKQLMSQDLTIAQLNSGISGSDFVLENELSEVSKIVGQQRSFRYFILPKDKVSAQVVVSEEEIQQYYDDNISRFQSDEQVKLEYVEVQRQDFFKPVDTADIQREYESEMDAFDADEERRVSHILIEITEERDESEALQEAEQLAEQLASGADFAVVASESSEDPGSANNAGDLGFTTGDTFPAEFEEALFALPLDQISEPVQTDAGYHLLKATEIRGVNPPALEERESAIKRRLQITAAEAEFVKTVEDLRDLAFNSEGLAGPAEDLDLALQQSGLISRSSAAGSLSSPQVIAAAFSQEVVTDGNNSDVLELAPDHFIVVSVSEHSPSKAKPLSNVRPLIVAELSQQRATELSVELATNAIEAMKAGKEVAEIAQEGGYEWQVQQNVTRNSASVEPALMRAVFAMPDISGGDVRREAVTLGNGDVAVVQLEEVEEGSWQQFSSAEQRELKSQLQRNSADGSMSGFLQSLRSKADVSIL